MADSPKRGDGIDTRPGGGSAARPESAGRARVSRRLPRAVLLAGIAALLVCALAFAWWFGIGRPEPVRYVTAPVTRGSIARVVTATGTVNPVLTIIVGSYVSGVVQSQYCDFNTRVRKGQLCAKIDPRPYQTVVNQARAELANARAQIVKDRAQLTYAKRTYERDAELLGHGIVSQDAADNARSAYDQARAQVLVDDAAIEQRSAALDAAQVNLDYTNIVSPVDGTVVSRNITIGQTVAASFQTPTLFLIATDLTRMQVDTNVSESDIGDLREGNAAKFTVEAFPKRQFTGSVVQVRQAPQTVQNVVTYDVVVGVVNDDLSLKPGMTATTRIVIDQRDGVLRVPDQALRFTSLRAAATATGQASAPSTAKPTSSARVWVLRRGRPTAILITTGLDDDVYSEVTGGPLTEGDAVIVGENQAVAGAGASAATAPRLHM
ncbi:HlyD family secretion protein [Trinickia symbiotica]|uniref:Efflux transporter periplasmic adaptor subunit n=1 Tax=Trinickia symbiotica TaxID=863227 RepID=A0A2N7X5V9_9BURK|nr:efflux RND transporter periplasmic adaptor subunit [Trinickia symbiotica]PMS36855.1 efflux transporter periplasmic adaptor subunit [Trinickia symbiotica]PPK46080.1 HlyD family secretion protein [Trinickia symbiotica]